MVPFEDNGEINLGKLLPHLTNFQYQLLTDSETYRELRTFIDQSFNTGKYTTVDGNFDFNDAFQDSIFKKTFIQFIKDSFKSNGSEGILEYDFYLKSYAALDSLGISKDKLSKKNRFGNLFNDGLHSYYAKYFDYFVTDDFQTLQKSKALYNLYGYDTQVMTTEEFLKVIPIVGKSSEDNLINFFEKLAKDIRGVDIISSKEIDQGFLSQGILESNYLNVFDEYLELKNDDGRHFCLTKLEKNHLSQPNFREASQIINRCISLFGLDYGQVGEFNFEKEVKEINDKVWNGRFWKIGSLDFYLHQNTGFNKICLWISSIPNQN